MENTHSIMDIFGTNVFNDKAMRQYLPKSIYYELRKTIEGRKDLDPAIADVVAAAIKKWAIEKGATHYTHWFQPLDSPPRNMTLLSPRQRKMDLF